MPASATQPGNAAVSGRRLWWPLFFAPLLGAAIAVGLIRIGLPIDDSFIGLIIWPAIFAFAISLIALARSTHGPYAQFGLALLSAALAVPTAFLVVVLALSITCDGDCL